ncbi:hypothetical protein JMA_42330 (plasmid) [Jeotgalibacillus malaysiensis]|uniref:Uncharacterized protein n=1 Tax=Jeotgalibacillus malaysiensis TaxID=1508404 RepID=A0A0B5ATK9_9BACL|nr:hypothetical protein [Jeotgalibacillus malaysiensis]AJD93550.1 hypothetical protein JMA_42330 [Jeotgalibacillus malaysiensis]
MNHEIYQKVDKWSRLFFENKEELARFAKQKMNENTQGDIFHYIAFHMGNEQDLYFEVHIIYAPDGTVEVTAVGDYYSEEERALIEERIHRGEYGTPRASTQIQCKCLVKRIEGKACLFANTTVIMRKNQVETAPPGEKVGEIAMYFSDVLTEGEEKDTAKEVSLSVEALDELMSIQKEFMLKERDLKGIRNLEESYANLKNNKREE